MDRLLHRDRRTRLEQRLKRLSRNIGDHTEHLAQLDGRRERIQPALGEWRAWRSDHKTDLDRLKDLTLHCNIAADVQRTHQELPLGSCAASLEQESPDYAVDR